MIRLLARTCTVAVLSSLAVFYLASAACKDEACPFSRAASRGTPPRPDPECPSLPPSSSVSSLAHSVLHLDRQDRGTLLLSFYRCTLRSEWAVLAMVAAVWATIAALSQVTAALLIGPLRPAEVDSLQARALRYNLGKAFHVLYIIAAADDGYHEFAVTTCWWAFTGALFLLLGLCNDRCTKLLQAQAVPLAKLTRIQAYVSFQCLAMLFVGYLWATSWRRHITTVFFFELFAIPAHVIRSVKLLTKHVVYIVTEVEERARARREANAPEDTHSDEGAPGPTLQAWHGTLDFYADLVCGVLDDLLMVVHHSAILAVFGMRLRLVDVVVMIDIRCRCVKLLDSLNGFILYRVASHNIHHSFQDADAAALERCGGNCSICFAALTRGTPAKQLPCSHVFHLACLRSWVQQSDNVVASNFTCPVCRSPLYIQTPTGPAKGPFALLSRALRFLHLPSLQLGLQMQADGMGLEAAGTEDPAAARRHSSPGAHAAAAAAPAAGGAGPSSAHADGDHARGMCHHGHQAAGLDGLLSEGLGGARSDGDGDGRDDGAVTGQAGPSRGGPRRRGWADALHAPPPPPRPPRRSTRIASLAAQAQALSPSGRGHSDAHTPQDAHDPDCDSDTDDPGALHNIAHRRGWGTRRAQSVAIMQDEDDVCSVGASVGRSLSELIEGGLRSRARSSRAQRAREYQEARSLQDDAESSPAPP